MSRRTARTACVLAALCLIALFASPLAPTARADGEARDITKKCTIKVSEGDRSNLTDSKVYSNWSYEHTDAYVGVMLPEGVEAGWLRVEWFYDPTGYELIEYDADKKEIRRRDESDYFPNIYSMFELQPGTKYIELKMTALDQKIGNLAVYSAGTLPGDVQNWNPPVEKADLMIFSTHQDDEIIFLGGTIPYYATALGKPTIVVYMTNCGRTRRAEALNALWKMGVRDYPDFINLEDDKVSSIKEGVELWGGRDNILSLEVERIRRYKPEVIVTQDLNGEYGHNQHKILARSIKYAIDAAADPAQYIESCELYGEWQVKKLYHHLYKENQIVMNWTKPLDSLHGYSPLEVAQLGMKEHVSQQKYYAVKDHGTYDNSKFGLYFTTVGDDVEKDDFLEHIDPDASARYLEEHADEIAERKAAAARRAAEAAATPEPAPTEAPGEPGEDAMPDEPGDDVPEAAAAPQDDEPALRPSAAPSKAREQAGASAVLPAVMIGLGIAAVGLGGWYGWRVLHMDRRRNRRRGRRY